MVNKLISSHWVLVCVYNYPFHWCWFVWTLITDLHLDLSLELTGSGFIEIDIRTHLLRSIKCFWCPLTGQKRLLMHPSWKLCGLSASKWKWEEEGSSFDEETAKLKIIAHLIKIGLILLFDLLLDSAVS